MVESESVQRWKAEMEARTVSSTDWEEVWAEEDRQRVEDVKKALMDEFFEKPATFVGLIMEHEWAEIAEVAAAALPGMPRAG